MADGVFNIAKGRVTQLYDNVDTNNPANSAIGWMALATSGLEADSVLRDKDDVAALVSGTTNEVTNSGYARKIHTDSDLSAWSPDDTNDRVDLDCPDLTWTSVSSGDGWSKLVSFYDNDTTGGSDSNLIPLTFHDFVITPDGSDITATIAAAGFYRAA